MLIYKKVVDVIAIHTTSELRALHQRYYEELRGKSGSGVPARSLQCASAVNDMLGMAVTYGIADRKFINVTKPKVNSLIFKRLVTSYSMHLLNDNTKKIFYSII